MAVAADGGIIPAKEEMAKSAPAEFRQTPTGVLPRHHTNDDGNGKEVYRG
jgi:hypothetical protein